MNNTLKVPDFWGKSGRNNIAEKIAEKMAIQQSEAIDKVVLEELQKSPILYWLYKKTKIRYFARLVELEIRYFQGDWSRIEIWKKGKFIKSISHSI